MSRRHAKGNAEGDGLPVPTNGQPKPARPRRRQPGQTVLFSPSRGGAFEAAPATVQNELIELVAAAIIAALTEDFRRDGYFPSGSEPSDR